MQSLFFDFLASCWDIILDSAPYMLLGFFLAGLIKAFIPEDFVKKHLGLNGLTSVIKAAVLGIPLPLCSCGVIPAAAGLRKQGASKGATASFLISVPETGVDSIAVTYALLDPIMTIFRPIAAFITAILAGFSINLADKEKLAPAAIPKECLEEGCACTLPPCDQTLTSKLKLGFSYSFGDLLADIGKWFVIGILIAATLSTLLPQDFLPKYLGSGLLPMLVVLLVSIPLYVCATASTPIVAVLALKGLSPGAALIFLLAGPATNAASLTMVARILGKKSTIIYLLAIVITSLGLGLGTDYLYGLLEMDISSWVAQGEEESTNWFSISCAVLLVLLIVRSLIVSEE